MVNYDKTLLINLCLRSARLNGLSILLDEAVVYHFRAVKFWIMELDEGLSFCSHIKQSL